MFGNNIALKWTAQKVAAIATIEGSFTYLQGTPVLSQVDDSHRVTNLARGDSWSKAQLGRHNPVTVEAAEARRLLAIVEKSQVPFGESAPIFAKVKAQIDAGKPLSGEDYEHLLRLVKIARDWNKAEESSAMTEREETLSG